LEKLRQIGGFASRPFERFASNSSTATMQLNPAEAKAFCLKR